MAFSRYSACRVDRESPLPKIPPNHDNRCRHPRPHRETGRSLLFHHSLRRLLVLCLVALAAVSAEAGRLEDFFRSRAFAPSRAIHPTRIRFLPENQDAWFARWWMLSEAKESIDATYFALHDDIFGRSMLGLILKKAKEGVKVRLMCDARGSLIVARRWLRHAYLRELASLPNVEIKIFKPLTKVVLGLPENLQELVASDHDKIILVDKKYAVIGGRNTEMHYYVTPEDEPTAYRDNDILVEGVEVGAQIEAAFAEEFGLLINAKVNEPLLDWFDSSLELELNRMVMERWISTGTVHPPEGSEYKRALKRLNKEISRFPGNVGFEQFRQDPWGGSRVLPCKVLDKHSYGGPRNDITPNLMALFDQAKDYILLQSAYVVLTDEAFGALKRAGERGVKVLILTNSPVSTDSKPTQAFFLDEWLRILSEIPGARVLMFTSKRKIHAKTFVIDDEITCIGSYNMDPMSQNINSEVLAVIASSDMAKRVRLRIEQDLAVATECKIEKDAYGNVKAIVGPHQYLKGWNGLVIKFLHWMRWLRPLV